MRINDCAHPHKKHYAGGLCCNCYQSFYLITHPKAREKNIKSTKKLNSKAKELTEYYKSISAEEFLDLVNFEEI